MKGTDKFLVGIVAAVLLTVIFAVVVVVSRPLPSYKEENTAEGAAHNYLLALQKQDYARAYSYLSSSLPGYPRSIDRFVDQVRGNEYTFPLDDDSITLAIDSSKPIAGTAGRLQVSVRRTTFYTGGLFGSSQYSSFFDMELQREGEAWKIRASDRYFLSCWTQTAGCK